MWDFVFRILFQTAVSEVKHEPSSSKLHMYHSKGDNNKQGLTLKTSSCNSTFSDALAITLRMLIEALMSAIVSLESELSVELFLSPSNISMATIWVAPSPLKKF